MQRRIVEGTVFEIEIQCRYYDYAVGERTADKAKTIKCNRFVLEMLVRYRIHDQRS